MITVLCYGDSNTYGRDPVTKRRMERDVRWPGVLQNTLGSNYHVIEEGLNGRTTVWDDPIRPGYFKRNGAWYLLPCLESHCPVDLLILMLGTNDLKAMFSVTPYDIAESMGRLVEIALGSKCGRDDNPPQIAVMCPPPLGKLSEYAETFSGGVEKSKKLAPYYEKVAKKYGCRFFDAGSVIQSSTLDGLHYDPEDHGKLGKAVAGLVLDIFK
ncbi:MAG: SGNH/GDSL hydrolase family protein [Spirochaetes bacterium]|nr:SGNH/GDSL hydrolase family protein [Spirochaetota bacterium]